jgi:hypothetical protein
VATGATRMTADLVALIADWISVALGGNRAKWTRFAEGDAEANNSSTRRLTLVRIGRELAASRHARLSKEQRIIGSRRGRPLLRFVHLSSERTVEPVRKDRSFAEKQQPQPAGLLVVLSGRERLGCGHARVLAGAEAITAICAG